MKLAWIHTSPYIFLVATFMNSPKEILKLNYRLCNFHMYLTVLLGYFGISITHFILQVKPEQATKLAACIVGDIAESSDLYNGIEIGEERYIFYKCIPDKYIHGRKSTKEAGIFIMKTKKAILFGTYGRGIQYENCYSVLDKLAEYLIQRNL